MFKKKIRKEITQSFHVVYIHCSISGFNLTIIHSSYIRYLGISYFVLRHYVYLNIPFYKYYHCFPLLLYFICIYIDLHFYTITLFVILMFPKKFFIKQSVWIKKKFNVWKQTKEKIIILSSQLCQRLFEKFNSQKKNTLNIKDVHHRVKIIFLRKGKNRFKEMIDILWFLVLSPLPWETFQLVSM